MNPILSIITINYNNLKGLKQTMDSVFTQQSREQFEYIVIDGNSTDGSSDLIQENSNKIDKWLSEPDKGIYNAMNKGIKMSKGTYLLFLNSGDCLYEKTTIQTIIKEFSEDLDIYYGDIIYDEGFKKEHRTFPDKLTFKFFYNHNISHQASFIKKDLFDSIFYYNENFKIVSDWEFFTYAICKKEASYKHLPIIVTVYEATGLSSNTDNHPAMYAEREASLNKLFPEFIADYNYLKELEFKKLQQFMHIKKHKVAYAFLKAFMKVILLFLPKYNSKTQ